MAKHRFKEVKKKKYTNKTTGEIEELEASKWVTIRIGKDEKFWMTFCRYTAPLYQLTHVDDIKIIVKFCELAEYDSGVVHLTPSRRKEMVAELGMQQSNVSKSLKRLKEKSLITGEDGEYKITPTLFWKGERSKRVELLRDKGLQVTFNFKLDTGNDE
jgi:DNA-binding transcriptional ArsR family regulator